MSEVPLYKRERKVVASTVSLCVPTACVYVPYLLDTGSTGQETLRSGLPRLAPKWAENPLHYLLEAPYTPTVLPTVGPMAYRLQSY